MESQTVAELSATLVRSVVADVDTPQPRRIVTTQSPVRGHPSRYYLWCIRRRHRCCIGDDGLGIDLRGV